MPMVPVTNRQVLPEAFDVPSPRMPTPVKEAYTGVADANVENAAKLNQMAGNIADKVVQNNLWQEQARIYDSREKLANDITGIMSSSELQTIKDKEGKEYQVPSGILNRQGFAAQGSASEYMSKVAPLREQYLSQFKMPQLKAQAARQFDSLVSQGYRQVQQHESTQVRDGVAKTFIDSSLNEVKNATTKGTPDDLMDSMEHIHESYMKYGAFKGLSPEEIQTGVTPMYAKAAENSAMNVLRSSGNLDLAMNQLDAVKTLIPNDYQKISEQLTRHNDIMVRQVEHQDLVKKVDTEFGIISDFAMPGATPPTVLEIEHMAASGAVRNEFAADYSEAMKAFEKEKGKPLGKNLPASLNLKDQSEQMASFGSYMKNIMESQDKDGVITVLRGAMKSAAQRKLSEDKLKITMFYALQRGNMLESAGKTMEGISKDLSNLDSSVKALNDFHVKSGGMDQQLYGDFFNALNNGANPKESLESAKRSAAIRNNPDIVSTPVTGKTMIDKYGNRAMVFPDGHIEEVK